MPILVGLVAMVIGWALWTKRLNITQIWPILLAVAGAFLALKGQIVIGAAAVAIAAMWFRGLTWRLFGTRSKQSHQYHIDQARWLLGVTVHDGADIIRARHRQLITENHPDTGGNPERAKQLNKARDLLLDELNANRR